jgi:DNA mismatch repair protein MutL
MRRTYLVCEAPGEGDLVLIDQHAAHERVVFEQLRKAHDRRETRRTRLLFPVPVDVGPNLPPITASEVAALEVLGFEVAPGVSVSVGSQVLLRAVPEVLKDADPKPLLREVLRQLAADPGDVGENRPPMEGDRMDRILSTMACHTAVRNGDALGSPQVQALLAQLDGIDLHAHRPHGRPLLIRVVASEIERRFGRG